MHADVGPLSEEVAQLQKQVKATMESSQQVRVRVRV